MQCKSCLEEIPSKFGHAIANNACPMCGLKIMDDDLKNILTELRALMNEAADKEYQAEVIDLLKNYDLISIESDEYNTLIQTMTDLNSVVEAQKQELETTKKELEEAKRNTKPIPKSGKTPQEIKFAVDEKTGEQLQITGESIQDQDTTDQFKKRAGVKKTNQDHFKSMINRIKGSTTKESSGGGANISAQELMNATPEEIEALESQMEQFVVQGSTPGIMSGSDMGGAVGDDDEIPAEVLAFAGVSGGNNSGGYNPKDVAALQKQINKSASVSRALDGGGSVGLIRR